MDENGLNDLRRTTLTIRISTRSKEILNESYKKYANVGESLSNFIIRSIVEYAEIRTKEDQPNPRKIPDELREKLVSKILRAIERHADADGWISRTKILGTVSYRCSAYDVNAVLIDLIESGMIETNYLRLGDSQKNSVVYRIVKK